MHRADYLCLAIVADAYGRRVVGPRTGSITPISGVNARCSHSGALDDSTAIGDQRRSSYFALSRCCQFFAVLSITPAGSSATHLSRIPASLNR